jgi:hypothetical protein
MECFLNRLAYFFTTVNYSHKIFIKLTPMITVVNFLQNKLHGPLNVFSLAVFLMFTSLFFTSVNYGRKIFITPVLPRRCRAVSP